MCGSGPTRAITLLIAWCAFASGTAWSQEVDHEASVEITSTAREAITGSGEAVTIPIRLVNRSASTQTLTYHLELPDGWSLATPLVPVSVPADSSIGRILLVRVPDGAPAGRYLAVVSTLGTDRKVIGTAVHPIHVSAVCRAALTVQADADFVEAGGWLKIDAQLRNEGNVALAAVLRVRTHTAHLVVGPVDTLVVSPTDSRTFSVLIHAEEQVEQKTRRSVLLAVDPVGCAGPGVDATRTVSFDVIPKAGELKEANSVLPASMTLSTGGGSSGVGGHVEVSAGGFVDRARKRQVELHLRLPDDRATRFGRRSMLKMRYVASKLAVTAGDFRAGYGLLSSASGVGRGVSIDARHRGLRGAAFWSRPHFRFPVRERSGVMLGIASGEQASIGALFSRQTGVDKRESVTLMAEIAPIRNTSLQLEFGDSFRGTTGASAAAIQLVGSQTGVLTYSGRYIYAGPRFPGQFANYEFTQGSLSVRPLPGLHVSSGGRMERRTFESVRDGTPSLKTNEYYDLGLGWRLRSLQSEITTAATAAYSKRSLSGPSEEVADQRHAGLEVRLAQPRFAVGAAIQYGRYSDRVLRIADTFTRTTISARAGNGSHNAGIALEWSQGRMITRPLAGSVLGGRINVETRLTDNVRMEASAYVSRDGFWSDGLYRLVDVRAVHSVGQGGQVSVRAVHSSVGESEAGSTDLGISLRWPLSVPNPLRTRARRFEGQVVDFESGSPLSGVLVQVGDQHALTDLKGHFTLRRPTGGVRLVRLDMSTIGVDYVPMSEIPLAVDFDTSVESLELAVARASSVTVEAGMLSRQATLAGKDKFSQVVPLKSAVIEIEDAVGRYRAVTNVAGKTAFLHVRPGEYSARIVYANLPPNYQIPVGVKFAVEPGGHARIELTATPTSRRMRMISLRNEDTKEAEAAAVPTRQEPSCDPVRTELTHHVVRQGETLSSIAAHHYGEPLLWPLIWLGNRSITDDPDWIRPGHALTIETPGPTLDRVDHRRTATYVTAPGDALPSVAARFTGDARLWPMIWWANRSRIADPNQLPADLRLVWPSMRLVPHATSSCDDKKSGIVPE